MFTFIHAADLHLDSPLKGLERYPGVAADEIRSATRRALENLVNLAIEQAVQFIVISGDIYDGDWKDHNTGLYFISEMSRLRSAGIPVIMIAGNHDAANKMTRSLILPDNVEMLSARRAETASHPRLEELGVAVHGRSFAHAAEHSNLVLEYPAKRKGMFNIGLLHTALDGAEGHDRYAPCSIQDLQQREYDYWALGHVHHRQVLCTSPHIVYSGNTQGRHIRETGVKGCYVVTVGDAGSVSLTFEPLDLMRWEICQIDASEAEHPEQLLGPLHETLSLLSTQHGELPIAVRVIVSGASACHDALFADFEHWSNQFRAVARQTSTPVWIEQVKISTTTCNQYRDDPIGDGPREELQKCHRQWWDAADQFDWSACDCQELIRRLPSELLSGPESLNSGDTEQVRRWLDEALAIVNSRLGPRSAQ